MPAPSATLQGLSFSHSDAVPLFDGVDLRLDAGWTGVVGPNGSGKSTLLSLLAGALRPQAGSTRFEPERARRVLCPQEVEEPGAAVRALAEALGEALPGERADAEHQPGPDPAGAWRLIARLELEPAALGRWPTLSPGERKRWQVAAALALEPELLLLDEPQNHLDAAARRWLSDALSRFRGAGVLVSHDRDLLDALCARTLRLGPGGPRLYAGGFSKARAAWEAERTALVEAQAAARAEERKLRRRLADARRTRAQAEANRSSGARMRDANDSDQRSLGADFRAEQGEKAAGRSVTLLRRELEQAEEARAAIAIGKERGAEVFAGWQRPGARLLFTLAEGPLRAPDGRVLARAPALAVARDDRIHLAGPNGAGKSTLLRALLAAARLPAEQVLHLPQELTAEEALAALDAVRALQPEPRGRTLQLLAALGCDPGRLLASERPSPGEARKLLIARGLGELRAALALDEPQNHLDLPSIERLERALQAFPGALLLVSHDAAFARACARTRWTLEGGELRVSSIEGQPAR